VLILLINVVIGVQNHNKNIYVWYMIPDNEDDLDEAIEEVIKEVCGEEDKSKIKNMLLIIHLIILIIGCFKCCTNYTPEKEFW